MDEFPTTWEEVSDDEEFRTVRLRVPGGYLVAVRDDEYGLLAINFLPCPNHNWVLET